MEKQKSLIIFSLALNVLLSLLVAFLMLLQFGILNIGGIVEKENNDENIVREEEEEEPSEDTAEETSEESEEEIDEKEDWAAYTSEEMNFKISYPETKVISGNTISLALMERRYDELGETNCIEIGPVEGDQKASVSIGYIPVNTGPSNCFRTSVGGGEQTTQEVQIELGNGSSINGTKLTYIGEEGEQPYVNYRFNFDEPKIGLEEDEYSVFGIQIEYYPEYEDTYLDLYKEILKTFEWL